MPEVDVRWIAERLHRARDDLDASSVSSVKRMAGGASSLTFSACLIDAAGSRRPIVVKVAPPGLAPTLNRDVQRQARVMRALGERSGVPVPVILHEEPGHPPEEPPLVVMTLERGACLEPLTHKPEEDVPDPASIRCRALEAARIMARLHKFPWHEKGFADEPVTSLDDEVQRWIRAFATVPDDLAVGAHEVGQRLLAGSPSPMPPTLVHGDYRLGNMLCADNDIRAVIDWETWTIGDPRIDVGWLLMSCDSDSQPHAVRADVGLPNRDELLAEYREEGGVEPKDIAWFEALSQFKAGAMTALIVKHDRRRTIRQPFVSWWDPQVPQRFVALAREHLA